SKLASTIVHSLAPWSAICGILARDSHRTLRKPPTLRLTMHLSRALPYWRCSLVVAALSAAPISLAQPAKEKPVAPLEKLDTIEKQMKSDRRDVDVLSRKATDLVQGQQQLRERLIVAAQSAQGRERQLNEVEQKLALFETREAATMRALNGERGTL